VPRTYVSDGMHRPSNAKFALYVDKKDNRSYVKWIAFSFQSVGTSTLIIIITILYYNLRAGRD